MAALLLAYVPGLAENFLPESTPAALIMPADESAEPTDDNSAARL